MKELSKNQLAYVFGGAFFSYVPEIDYQAWLSYYDFGI